MTAFKSQRTPELRSVSKLTSFIHLKNTGPYMQAAYTTLNIKHI